MNAPDTYRKIESSGPATERPGSSAFRAGAMGTLTSETETR